MNRPNPTPVNIPAHRMQIHIRFRDLDVYGHVNNTVYLSYFEEGRVALFNSLIKEPWDWSKTGVLIANQTIDYKLPIELTDKVFIETTILSIGTKSITFGYKIFKKTQERELECTTGSTVVVCFDYRSQKTVEIPEKWRLLFTSDQP